MTHTAGQPRKKGLQRFDQSVQVLSNAAALSQPVMRPPIDGDDPYWSRQVFELYANVSLFSGVFVGFVMFVGGRLDYPHLSAEVQAHVPPGVIAEIPLPEGVRKRDAHLSFRAAPFLELYPSRSCTPLGPDGRVKVALTSRTDGVAGSRDGSAVSTTRTGVSRRKRQPT